MDHDVPVDSKVPNFTLNNNNNDNKNANIKKPTIIVFFNLKKILNQFNKIIIICISFAL